MWATGSMVLRSTGLHSHGFMDAAFKWLMAFVVRQLALIVLGLLPDITGSACETVREPHCGLFAENPAVAVPAPH